MTAHNDNGEDARALVERVRREVPGGARIAKVLNWLLDYSDAKKERQGSRVIELNDRRVFDRKMDELRAAAEASEQERRK